MTAGLLVGAGAVAIGGAVLLVLVLRRRYAVIVVDGESMLPTLRPGDQVLLRRTRPGAVRTGQVVVIQDRTDLPASRAHLTVKRVAAVAGDPVPAQLAMAWSQPAGSAVLPRQVAVLGDNATASLDSRQCGYIDQDRVLGVVLRFLSNPARDLSNPARERR